MKELVIKATGTIQESNIDEFKQSAFEFIENINTELVTDDDFVEASQNIKACKSAEDSLVKAKEDVLAQTKDINAVIKVLDEIQDKLRATRLDLTKKEKEEKAKRKNEIINNGYNNLAVFYANSDISFHLGRPDKNLIDDAVKGKRTITSMEDAILVIIKEEKERINLMVDNFHSNLALITDAETQSLFHDKEQLALKSESEVRAEITSREAQYKLEQKEKEELARIKAERIKEEQKEDPKPSQELDTLPMPEQVNIAKEPFLPPIDDEKEYTLIVKLKGTNEDIKKRVKFIENVNNVISVVFSK